MDVSTLEEFCELARTGNFSKAAKRLSTTQPVLSRHMQKLEQELGYPLLERTTRQVSLSEAGKQFLPCAQQIVDILQNYRQATRRNSDSGRLRIGMTENFNRSSIHDAIFRFASSRQISPEMSNGTIESLKEQLLQNQVDLVAAYERAGMEEESFSRLTYSSDVLAAALPRSHPLAQQQSIPLRALADEDFVLLRRDSMVGLLSRECCEEAGFQPRVLHDSKFEDNVLEMVRKGIAISLLLMNPRTAIGVSIVEIEPPIRVDLNLICRKGDPNLKELLDFMQANRPSAGG